MKCKANTILLMASTCMIRIETTHANHMEDDVTPKLHIILSFTYFMSSYGSSFVGVSYLVFGLLDWLKRKWALGFIFDLVTQIKR